MVVGFYLPKTIVQDKFHIIHRDAEISFVVLIVMPYRESIVWNLDK